jgi:hypothetical protein
MTNNTFRLFLLLIFIMLCFSCERKKVECYPKLYECEIKIIDKNGVNMIGNDKLYKPDSVAMIIKGSRWTILVDSSKILWNYSGLDSLNNTKYFLYLSSLDTDTIDFKISRQKGDCFDSFSIDTFEYNDKIIKPDTSDYKNRLIFKIVK